jgi:GntR family transcriptional regulator of arabinose operon
MNKVTDITISQNSFVSLHMQLHNQLRHLILSGRWANGSRIPSESEFVRHLKISRSTVRLALQQAEIQGLIERFPGRGTFVTYHPTQEYARRLVAFVIHWFDSDSLLLMLKGAEAEARGRGYQIILNTVQNQQEEIEVLQRLKDESISGVLIWPNAGASKEDPQNVLNYSAVGLPIVVMDRPIHGVDCDFVTSDHYSGAQALMEHLIELGHRQIAFLSNQQTYLYAVRERYRAYCDVMERNGLKPQQPWLIGQPNSELGGSDVLRASTSDRAACLEEIKALISAADPIPTAIFALHDYMAIMVMRALKQMNIPVPEGMSITGFDDLDMAAYMEVPLTTAAQDHFAIGRQAARRLFDRLEGYNGESVCEVIPTQLRIRASTSIPAYIQRR